QSVALFDDQLDLGILLSLEAYRRSNTVEARSSLLGGLQHRPSLLAFLHGHTGAVRGVAFSPHGNLLASASADGTVRLWDVASRRQVGQPLSGHMGTVRAVAFSPNGQTLASAGDDRTVRLWDTASGRQQGD